MKAIDTNIPAFPRPAGWNHCEGYNEAAHNEPQDGMSLRDWFAGQALSGVMAAPSMEYDLRVANVRQPSAVAEQCYLIADEMLKARKQ